MIDILPKIQKKLSSDFFTSLKSEDKNIDAVTGNFKDYMQICQNPENKDNEKSDISVNAKEQDNAEQKSEISGENAINPNVLDTVPFYINYEEINIQNADTQKRDVLNGLTDADFNMGYAQSIFEDTGNIDVDKKELSYENGIKEAFQPLEKDTYSLQAADRENTALTAEDAAQSQSLQANFKEAEKLADNRAIATDKSRDNKVLKDANGFEAVHSEKISEKILPESAVNRSEENANILNNIKIVMDENAVHGENASNSIIKENTTNSVSAEKRQGSVQQEAVVDTVFAQEEAFNGAVSKRSDRQSTLKNKTNEPVFGTETDKETISLKEVVSGYAYAKDAETISFREQKVVKIPFEEPEKQKNIDGPDSDRMAQIKMAAPSVYSGKENGITSIVKNENAVYQVSQSVVYMAKTGSKNFTIELFPEELGKVRVNLEYLHGELKLKIIAENDVSAKLLNEQLSQLKHSLAVNNIEVRDVDISSGNFDFSFSEMFGDQAKYQNSANGYHQYEHGLEEQNLQDGEVDVLYVKDQLLNCLI